MAKYIYSNPKTPSDTILCQIPIDDELITIMEQEYVAINSERKLELCNIFVLLNTQDRSLKILGYVDESNEVHVLSYGDVLITDDWFQYWPKQPDGSITHADLLRLFTVEVSGNKLLDTELLELDIDLRQYVMVTKTWEDLYRAIYRSNEPSKVVDLHPFQLTLDRVEKIVHESNKLSVLGEKIPADAVPIQSNPKTPSKKTLCSIPMEDSWIQLKEQEYVFNRSRNVLNVFDIAVLHHVKKQSFVILAIATVDPTWIYVVDYDRSPIDTSHQIHCPTKLLNQEYHTDLKTDKEKTIHIRHGRTLQQELMYHGINLTNYKYIGKLPEWIPTR